MHQKLQTQIMGVSSTVELRATIFRYLRKNVGGGNVAKPHPVARICIALHCLFCSAFCITREIIDAER